MEHLPAALGALLLLLVWSFPGECCAGTPASAQKADFYVSADGSDDWSGSLPEPNAQRKHMRIILVKRGSCIRLPQLQRAVIIPPSYTFTAF